MGALKGSITFTRFYVQSELTDADRKRIMDRIRTRAFKMLTAEDEEDVSVGWVPVEDPFNDVPSFSVASVYPDADHLVLSMRIDRWKFPPSLIKSKLQAAEREYLEKHGKTRISRAERAELRDMVDRRLRREGIPVTKVIDFVWSIPRGEVRVFTRSSSYLEYFAELFEKTMGKVSVTIDSPYLAAIEQSVGLTPAEKEAIATISPVAFHVRRTMSPTESNNKASLAELVHTKRFLGREFLTWLWFKGDGSAEGVRWAARSRHPNDEDDRIDELWFERSFILQNAGEDVKPEKVTLAADDPSETPEAKKALQQGKLLTRITVGFRDSRDNPREYALTVESDSFGISGMKIPALIVEEGDDPFVERMHLIETGQAAIDGLYAQFLRERLKPEFNTRTVKAIFQWMNGAEA
jgi:hypothetical protein